MTTKAELEAQIERLQSENATLKAKCKELEEQCLQDDRVTYRSLFFTINEGFILHEMVYDESGKAVDYRILDVNPAYESMVGYCQPHVIDKLASEVYGTPFEIERLDEVARTGFPSHYEQAYGSKILRVSLFAPKIGRVAAVFEDVTEYKRMQSELKAEKDFINTVLEAVGALVIVYNRWGRIVCFNRAAERITGYSFEQVENRYPWEFYLPEEDIDKFKDAIMELRDGQIPFQGPHTCIDREGTSHIIDWTNTFILDEHDDIGHIISTGIDITEQQKARDTLKQFHVLVENLADGACIATSPEGKILYANPALRKMLHHDGALQDTLVAHFIAKESWPKGNKIMKTLLESGTYRGKLMLKPKDGETFPVYLSATNITNGDSPHTTFAAIFYAQPDQE